MKIEIQLSDLLSLIAILVAIIVTFVTTKYTLREFVQTEVATLTMQIHFLKVEFEKLKTNHKETKRLLRDLNKQSIKNLQKQNFKKS